MPFTIAQEKLLEQNSIMFDAANALLKVAKSQECAVKDIQAAIVCLAEMIEDGRLRNNLEG